MRAILRDLKWAAPLLFLLAMLLPGEAFAGRITLNWAPNLTFSTSGDTITIRGTIDISNTGDERSLDVSPTLKLGSWEWAGEQKNIEAGSNSGWTISVDLPRSKLSCAADPSCGGLDLPDRGDFPLLLRVIYHDLNRYQFSGLEVLNATIGVENDSQTAAIRVPTILSLVRVEGDGRDFNADMELNNVSDRAIQAAVSFFVANEIMVNYKPESAEIAPHSVVKKTANLKNFSGLVGNSYRITGVAQWENGGLRAFSQAGHVFKLTPPDSSGMLFNAIWLLAGFSAALVFGVIIMLLRRPRSN